MTLPSRRVANAAGATPELYETVVERLIESGQIKIWKAQEIIAELEARAPGAAKSAPSAQARAAGRGKALLSGGPPLGYRRHAIAAPIPLAIEASVEDADDGVSLIIPRWGVE